MSFIKNLQQKSERTREKILWGSVIFAAIILVFLWIWQVRISISSVKIEVPSQLETFTEGFESLSEPLRDLKNMGSENLEELERLNKNLEEIQDIEANKTP